MLLTYNTRADNNPAGDVAINSEYIVAMMPSGDSQTVIQLGVPMTGAALTYIVHKPFKAVCADLHRGKQEK